MNQVKMAACGIDCSECAQYKVTAEHDLAAAESLVGWFRSEGWIGEYDGAESIMEKAPLCNGCWDKTGVCFCDDCGLRICCVEKELEHCGECSDFPCEEYVDWVGGYEHHKRAMKYLKALKKAK